jgi:hypothetical protein
MRAEYNVVLGLIALIAIGLLAVGAVHFLHLL